MADCMTPHRNPPQAAPRGAGTPQHPADPIERLLAGIKERRTHREDYE